MANPNAGNQAAFTTNTVNTLAPNNTGWNNAGELPGVLVVHQPMGYLTMQTTWRQIEGIGSGARRTADYNLYWGANGVVDSVIDVTHDVKVGLDDYGVRIINAGVDTLVDSTYNGGWGFLNAAAANTLTSFDQRLQVTITDIGCLRPYKDMNTAGGGGFINCPGSVYILSDTAKPGPTAFATSKRGGLEDPGPGHVPGLHPDDRRRRLPVSSSPTPAAPCRRRGRSGRCVTTSVPSPAATGTRDPRAPTPSLSSHGP